MSTIRTARWRAALGAAALAGAAQARRDAARRLHLFHPAARQPDPELHRRRTRRHLRRHRPELRRQCRVDRPRQGIGRPAPGRIGVQLDQRLRLRPRRRRPVRHRQRRQRRLRPQRLFAAQTGDTVFAIPSASTASGLSAVGLELLPPDSIPTAASVALDAAGDVFVADATGGGIGHGREDRRYHAEHLRLRLRFHRRARRSIPPPATCSSPRTCRTLRQPDQQFTAAGARCRRCRSPVRASAFGSIDLLLQQRRPAARLRASSATSCHSTLRRDVGAIRQRTRPSPRGMTVDPFTHRVQILSSTFTASPTRTSRCTASRRSISSAPARRGEPDCMHEAYGLQVVDGTAGLHRRRRLRQRAERRTMPASFPVGFCFNVDDPGLPNATTAATSPRSPISAKPASAAIATAAAAEQTSALPLSGSALFLQRR